MLQSLGKPYEAEQMLLKSFSIADKLGEIAIASVAVGNLALLYRETQNFDRAEEMLRQALQLEERMKHKDGIARANINLGTVLFEKVPLRGGRHAFQGEPAPLRGARPAGARLASGL